MGQGGNDSTSLKGVVLFILAACVIAFVISSAAGKKDGCLADGGQPRGLECVKPTPSAP